MKRIKVEKILINTVLVGYDDDTKKYYKLQDKETGIISDSFVTFNPSRDTEKYDITDIEAKKRKSFLKPDPNFIKKFGK